MSQEGTTVFNSESSDSEKPKVPTTTSVSNKGSFTRLLLSPKVLVDSVVRLNPVRLLSNPVMFIVEITFFIVAAMAIDPQAFYPVASLSERTFYVEVAIILLITVWFSTLSDSLAETQAKMTANSLRTLETEVMSNKIVPDGSGPRVTVKTPSTQLRKGDMILVQKDGSSSHRFGGPRGDRDGR